MEKKSLWLICVLVLLVGLAFGTVIGAAFLGKENILALQALDRDNVNSPTELSSLSKKTQDELMLDLSDIMMPKDEYEKLTLAILQTGMGLMNVQDGKVADQLKVRIENKYSRKYFADLNAKSMTELSKEDLEAILSFYLTPSGSKFLKISPQIIENTMKTVQMDLAAWLPKEVETIALEVKSGKPQKPTAP